MTDEARPRFGFPVAAWHRWFAWKPIRTYDGRWTWLRTVDRRLIQMHDYLPGGLGQWWQYRR